MALKTRRTHRRSTPADRDTSAKIPQHVEINLQKLNIEAAIDLLTEERDDERDGRDPQDSTQRPERLGKSHKSAKSKEEKGVKWNKVSVRKQPAYQQPVIIPIANTPIQLVKPDGMPTAAKPPRSPFPTPKSQETIITSTKQRRRSSDDLTYSDSSEEYADFSACELSEDNSSDSISDQSNSLADAASVDGVVEDVARNIKGRVVKERKIPSISVVNNLPHQANDTGKKHNEEGKDDEEESFLQYIGRKHASQMVTLLLSLTDKACGTATGPSSKNPMERPSSYQSRWQKSVDVHWCASTYCTECRNGARPKHRQGKDNDRYSGERSSSPIQFVATRDDSEEGQESIQREDYRYYEKYGRGSDEYVRVAAIL